MLFISVGMQQDYSIRNLTEIVRRANEQEPNEGVNLLLVNPSAEQYFDLIKLLHQCVNAPIPDENTIPLLQSDLFNYISIKPDKKNPTFNTTIEVYTVLRSTNSKIENDLYLIDVLQSKEQFIDVLVFEDCQSDKLTKCINSCVSDDPNVIKELIVSPVSDLLKSSTNNILMYLNKTAWKSATFINTNVSKWTYNSLTIPIVDFIQQYRRYNLHQCKTPCQLVYLPFSIHQENSRMEQIIINLLDSKPLTSPETQGIRYDNIHIVAALDSPEKIQLLDESFSWSMWDNTKST